jgi:hypothetical protein
MFTYITDKAHHLNYTTPMEILLYLLTFLLQQIPEDCLDSSLALAS